MDNAIRVIILIISLFLFGKQPWKFLFVVYGKTMQQEDPQGLIEAAKHLPCRKKELWLDVLERPLMIKKKISTKIHFFSTSI